MNIKLIRAFASEKEQSGSAGTAVDAVIVPAFKMRTG